MRRSLLPSFAAMLVLGLAPAAAASGGSSVVVDGLDNPRGVDVDLYGFVYVAEAGRGGSGPCIVGGEGSRQCVGRSGAITRIAFGRQSRVDGGLSSLADEGTGANASGPHDVDAVLPGFGSFVTGLGADPAARASLGPAGSGLAKLSTFGPFRRTVERADLGAYEAANDPDQNVLGAEGPDSNPTSVLKEGSGHVAVDAGGNDLLRVSSDGQISTLAVFPGRLVDFPFGPPGTKIPMQSVPTAVVKGPDGAFYVSELTGFPFPVGGANVYRVVPGSPPQVYVSGLTAVTDLAFGRDGSLYVVQHARNGLLSGDPSGDVIKIARNGTRTTVASDGLVRPYGIAIGRLGELYVTHHSTEAGAGELLRLRG